MLREFSVFLLLFSLLSLIVRLNEVALLLALGAVAILAIEWATAPRATEKNEKKMKNGGTAKQQLRDYKDRYFTHAS